MKKIILSLAMVVAMASVAAGATYAYFSSTATVTANTFATGTLELRVNGQPTVTGAQFSAVAPGAQVQSPVYTLSNFNQANFGGQSNLDAKSLILTVTNPNDYGSGLWQNVWITISVNRGWSTSEVVYNGYLKDLSTVNLFGTRWTDLAPGNSETMQYTAYLPESGSNQNNLMGKTLNWDFSIEARTN